MCFTFLLIMNSLQLFSQIDNESNFYTSISNANYNKDLVEDFAVDNSFSTDDSSILQNAIDVIAANGGGILTIPAGNYSFGNINLKSNVHLDIHKNVFIRSFYEIPFDEKLKNYAIFKLGDSTNPIQNVTISSSSGGNFTVDLTHNNNPNVAVVNCGKVSNFIIANFNILDTYTKFSAVIFGGDEYNGEYIFPKNGIVKNIDIKNAHYGYGTVQTQSAENILFKNLSGTGGATLRLETGFTGLNNLQGSNLPTGVKRIGGIDKIVARNIYNTNGNSALMISPHALHNGTVDAEEIHSVSSGFAVRIEAGFVSDKYDQDISLSDGTFEHVKVKSVTATYGENAEIKAKHFNHYPSEITPPTKLANYLIEDETKIYVGASIATVLAETNYNCKNNVKIVLVEAPIEGTGFLYQENIIPAEFLTTDCTALSTDEQHLNENLVEISPNPASNSIFINHLKKNKNINIYSLSGQLIKSIKTSYNSSLKLDVSNLISGIYFIKIVSENNSITKKIIIK
ncbi:Por secretion system C-terminal sorting domain-containing protein [Polaribacter sp. KT25b]|nr:Por secretion system C-terminal sorting domain-containing protein [Polaribacter sp. KT25b]